MGGVKIAYKALQSLAQERKADVARHGSLSGLSFLPLAPSLSLSLPLPCAGCLMPCLLAPLSSSSLSLVFFSLPLSPAVSISLRDSCVGSDSISLTHTHTLSLSHTYTYMNTYTNTKTRSGDYFSWHGARTGALSSANVPRSCSSLQVIGSCHLFTGHCAMSPLYMSLHRGHRTGHWVVPALYRSLWCELFTVSCGVSSLEVLASCHTYS